ncbi:immunoglobulin-like domain-containing protein [Paenibacillus sp. 32352]|uniref:immunoglobulin-like domain-containing protein n=1 Tax=Paenibacillus sp. 32352 TaxID=1969111 RepID=UPI0009AD7848|nr:immunoglobulin-like domain-containing protein [Paenibacillus sp. 32352]
MKKSVAIPMVALFLMAECGILWGIVHTVQTGMNSYASKNHHESPDPANTAKAVVPSSPPAAKLYADKTQFRSSETMSLHLKNESSSRISFGVGYKIDIQKNNEWAPYPMTIAFVDIGIMMEPGGGHDQDVPLNQLKKGHYRITKEVYLEGSGLQTVSFEFDMDG